MKDSEIDLTSFLIDKSNDKQTIPTTTGQTIAQRKHLLARYEAVMLGIYFIFIGVSVHKVCISKSVYNPELQRRLYMDQIPNIFVFENLTNTK